MSKGITKIQLAVAVQKGKILELKFMLENCSGGGSWRRYLIVRIKQLEDELKEIQGNVPIYVERQEKGLIS